MRSFAVLVVSASWGFLNVADDLLIPIGSLLWLINPGDWCELQVGKTGTLVCFRYFGKIV